jgi:hypothetical protein
MQINVHKIVSGGQTGADRGTWDFALEKGLEIGGWVPKNRLAEDGRISEKYTNLRETPSEDSAHRTESNVIDSDATLILSHNALAGGSTLTFEIAQEFNKPVLHINFDQFEIGPAVQNTRNWLSTIDCRILNVADPRASEDQSIYEKTRLFLAKVFE